MSAATNTVSQSPESNLAFGGGGHLVKLRLWLLLHRYEIGAAFIAVLPIIVATIRAIASGYTPVNDDALLLLRSRDVLTANHPLLGTLSSASLVFGVSVSNPGPFLFDLMAAPVKLFGSGPGLAIGVGLLNIACIIGAACMAYRIRGRSAFLAFLATASILAWGMGSDLLFDVWQPHSLIFPFLCFLVLVWGLSCGRTLALPWGVALGSYLLQTHLSYIYLVPGLLIASLGIGLTSKARDRSVKVRAIGWTGAVLVLVWAQPLWQQFFGPGPGNLTRLFNAATGAYGSAASYGSSLALSISAAVFAIPPWRQRPAFAERLTTERTPSLLEAVSILVVLLCLLLLIFLKSKSTEYLPERRAAVLSMLLVAISWFSLQSQPVSGFGFIAPHQVRWLWPIGSFILFTFLLRLGSVGDDERIVAGILTSLIVLSAALNLPASRFEHITPGIGEATPAVARMIKQVDALRGRGTLRFVINTKTFGEPFSSPLLAALAQKGIPFVVPDPILGGQVGERRRLEYCRPNCGIGASILVANGDAAFEAGGDSERVIFVQGISAKNRERLKILEQDLLSRGAIRDFQGMLLAKHPSDKPKAKKYAELKRALVYGTVAVYLQPVP